MFPLQRILAQYRKDLKLWLFCMAVLTVLRAALIFHFRSRISTGAAADVLLAMLNGLRFDGMAAGYWVLTPFFLSTCCAAFDLRVAADRARSALGAAFAVATPLLFTISLVYFREYNDTFNHFLFNLYYDDTRAILATIWTGYRPVLNGLIGGSMAVVLLLLLRAWMGGVKDRPAPAGRPAIPASLAVVLTALVLFTGSLRGSFGHRPAKLEDAAITADPFLNKAVLNPYSALTYAFRTHRKLHRIVGGLDQFLPDGNVRRAAQEAFGGRLADDLDGSLLKSAAGAKNSPPRHIFLVVMESYDAWPLLDHYAPLGLASELGTLAREGIHIARFLPASDGTATSLAALVTGLADANVVTNYQKNSERPYASSIATAFQRLGYRTRFFYGGFLGWQRIGDFMQAQGFEEVFGGGSMTAAERTEWGIEDDALFTFALSTVEAEERPSFNLILTTSYHPPYDMDVYRKGFPLRAVPDAFAQQFDGTTTLAMLGHLWYSDQCIGRFVRNAERRLTGPLFAFTGDHFSRKFLNDHPGAFEGAAVPLVLYGRSALDGIRVPAGAAGSHIDIGPTLIELAAPRGFRYHSLGRNLLSDRDAPLGISRDWVIGPDFLLSVHDGAFHPLPGVRLPGRLPAARELQRAHHRLHGLSWWRIVRGPSLPLSLKVQ